MNSDKKMQNVECLRFLFTLGICIHHFLYASGIYSNGYLAVEFFFILSGFLLVYTFNARKTVTTFIKSKIIRFVPILFFVSLLYCFFTSDFYFDSLVSNTLFLFFPGLKYRPGYADGAWFIAVLFWALLFYFSMMKYWKKETACFITGIIVFWVYIILMSTSWDRLVRINILLNVNLLRALGGVGIGYLLASYVLMKPLSILPKKYMYSFLEIVFLLYSFGALFSEVIYPKNPLYVVLSFVVLLYLFVVKKGSISQYLDHFQWSKISKYTLSIYLVQDIVIFILYARLLDIYPEWIKERIFMVMLAVILTCCVFGMCLYLLIEKPCGTFLKKLLNGEYVSKNKD